MMVEIKLFFKLIIEFIIEINNDIMNLHMLYDMMVKYKNFNLIDKYRDIFLNNRIWEYQVSQNDLDFYSFVEDNRLINAYIDIILSIEDDSYRFRKCRKNIKWLFDEVAVETNDIEYQFILINHLVNTYFNEKLINLRVKYDINHTVEGFTEYVEISTLVNIEQNSLFELFIKKILSIDIEMYKYYHSAIIYSEYSIKSILTKMIEIGANPIDVLPYFNIEKVKYTDISFIEDISIIEYTQHVDTESYLIAILSELSPKFR